MFIRIIQTEPAGETDRIIECEDVKFSPLDEERVTIFVTVNYGTTRFMERVFDVYKADAVVYVMNSSGKTIDSYKWDKDRSSG